MIGTTAAPGVRIGRGDAGRGSWARWLALPTLALVLALVVEASRAIETAPLEAPAAGKLTRAERAMVYELTPAGGPRFRLAGGAEVVQLLVHLELARGADVADVYRFGIEATLRGPDGTALWQRTVTQRARQTKEGRRVGGWDYEAAFVVDGQVELTDAATVELALPDAPPGSALELKLSEETGVTTGAGLRRFAAPSALVRAYRRQGVDPAEREIRRLALANRGERRLPETFLPWYALASAQQELRLTAAWERLAAEGRAGVDYRVRSIYVAPARPPVAPPAEVPALMLGAGQPLVIQLAGPGTVWVDARVGEGATAEVRAGLREVVAADAVAVGPGREDRSGGVRVIERRGSSGLIERRASAGAGRGDRSEAAVTGGSWTIAAAPVGSAEISVPAGWWSLELATDAPAVAVQVRADAPARHAGPDDHAVHADAAVPLRPGLMPVDVRTLPMYAQGPGTQRLVVALPPGDEPEGRFVRVEARAWGTLAPVTVRYSFVDQAGAVLSTGERVVETTRAAPYERLRGGAAGADEDVPEDSPVVFPLGAAPVSEPVAIGLIAPPGSARMVLSTVGPALVAVHGRLPGSTIAAGRWTWPYDQLVDPGLRWRYAPPAAPRTFPRRAVDHAARVLAGQVRTIAAQVRVEAAPATAAVDGPWRAEQPRGAHSRLRLLEEVQPGRRGAALAAWGPGSYTRLRPGTPERLDLSVGAPRPSRLRYYATGSALAAVGSSLFVTVDGEGSRWPVTTRSGRRTLPRRGQSEVIWSGPGNVAVLANRPPVGGSGAPLYEHRQVHQLGAGGLAVTIDKPSKAPVGVNVVVYWVDGSPRAPTEVAVEVDDGAPRRRQGVPVAGVFAAKRTVAVAPTRRGGAIFADRRGEGEVAIGRFAVVLGDDVAPGRHTVRVRHAGGPAAWVRFFRAGKAEVKTGAWQWAERRTVTSTKTEIVEEELDADE